MTIGCRAFNLDGVDYVMVTKDTYESLVDSQERLSLLEAYGVDNWEGYGEAMSEFYSDEDED